MYANQPFDNGFIRFLFEKYVIAIAGLVMFFGCMIARSLKDDPGYHIHPEELEGEGVHQ
jgi:cytochrome c oxidase subunit 1